MKADDFNILELCRKLRRVKNPPYTCPIEECGKVYQGLCGLQYHLNHANHSIAKLKIFFDELPNIPAPTPHKSQSRRRGRLARLPEPPPVVVQNVDSADDENHEESKLFVQFEVNNKVIHVNIKTPMKVLDKEDYEEEYGDKSNNAHNISSNLAKCREAVTKLPVASFREISSYNIPDATPLPNSYIRFIERSPEELDVEVEYDMDEEDTAWLEMMNENRAKNDLPPVSMESFELLMDRLEKESYFLVQMNKEVDSSLAVIDDEAVCSICLDGECQNSNVILFCDMCNLAVHQDCYGVPYIPEGHWLCRRCLHSPSAPVDCVLCPNNGGAFKQTDRAHWAHVVCALWIPEVRFANTVFLEPIDSIESIPAARWRLTCYICKQRGVGACIQCHKTNCYSAFHVTCAQQAGLYMKMETVRDNNLGAVLVQKIAYCDTHAPIDPESKARMQAANKKKDISVSPNDKMKTARRVLAKKRSVAPVISIPTIPPERIQEIASFITTPKKSYFIQRLIAYWTLKRQFRNGVPLLRRLQTSHLARRDESKQSIEQVTDIAELYRQLKYWQSLRQDLERARLLCELVRKREKFKKEQVKVKEEYVETALNPFNAFLHKVVAQLKARDTGEIFIEPVDQNEVPDYGDIIKNPMDLQTMTEKIKDFQYGNVEALEADFNLMISNCLAYNSKETIFYKAGIRMKEQGGVIIRQAKKDFINNRFDMSTGLLIGQASFREVQNDESKVESTPVEEVQAAEIDKELAAIADSDNRMDDNEIMCKLLQLLDKSELLKHKGARMKRVKLVKMQMANIKRKLTRQSKAQTPAHNTFEKEEKLTESELDETTNDSVPDITKSTPETSTKRKAVVVENLKERSRRKRKDISAEPSVSDQKKCDKLKDTPRTPETPAIFKRPDIPTSSGSEKKSVVIKRRRNKRLSNAAGSSKALIPNSESFRVYRMSNEMPDETDEETHSEEEESSSSCSCSDEETENSSSDSDENSDPDDGQIAENDNEGENDDDVSDDDDEDEDDDDDDEDDD